MANLKFRGHIYRVTDPLGFIASYEGSDGRSPDPATFAPSTSARIYLAYKRKVDLKDFLEDPVEAARRLLGIVPFIPDESIRTKANGNGGFDFEWPDALGLAKSAAKETARLVVYRVVDEVMNVELLGPVYRTGWFKLGDVCDKSHKIYYIRQPMPDEMALDAAAVKSQLDQGAVGANGHLDSLSISSGSIRVEGSASSAKIQFKIKVRPLTSSDRGSILASQLEDFDVDLPGPDGFTRAVINVAELGSSSARKAGRAIRNAERVIGEAVASFVKEAGDALVAGVVQQIADRTEIPRAQVQQFLDQQTVISIERVRWPVVDERRMGLVTVRKHAIAADLAVGFPRQFA